MKNLHKKALQAYIEMLTIHIDTKVSDPLFHSETEAFYETLFDVAHEIWERYVDLWGQIEDSSLEEKKKKSEQIIADLQQEIEEYSKENKVSLGTHHLLWELASKIENM